MVKPSRTLALRLPEPALQGNWFVNLPGVAPRSGLVVESADPTYPEIPANARQGGGTNTYYPGLADIDGMSLILYETDNHDVHKYIHDWRKLIFDNSNGFYGVPADYKRNVIVEYFSIDSERPVLTSEYVGCWPTDQQAYNLTYDSIDGRLTLSVTLSVDDVNFS